MMSNSEGKTWQVDSTEQASTLTCPKCVCCDCRWGVNDARMGRMYGIRLEMASRRDGRSRVDAALLTSLKRWGWAA